MPTFNLRRFAHPDGLKAIARKNLLALLRPHKRYFVDRGLKLPPPSASDDLDYDQLVEVLMSPITHTPELLLDALFFVHEMATPEGMDALLQEAESRGILLDGRPDPTPADVAVQVYLQDKDLLERKHAERYLTKRRSYAYFQTEERPVPRFKPPSTRKLTALQTSLDDWFEKKKRGRGCRVFVYHKEDAVWFSVRHGDPMRREGSLDSGQPSSVFYRPERFDVLVYEPDTGELRINACNKGERETFRKEFGRHLFENEDSFPGTGKYTLEPLRTNGEASIVCTDIDGMEWVRLKEIQFIWGGSEKEIEIRKANDLIAVYTRPERSMPKMARIFRASFTVKFVDSSTTRTVTIRPSNIALYTRDSDATVVEEWLTKRGFILTEQEDDDE